MKEEKLPKYSMKEVLNILNVSQSTLYRIRKKNGLLTSHIKRRYSEQEVEELGMLILNNYNHNTRN